MRTPLANRRMRRVRRLRGGACHHATNSHDQVVHHACCTGKGVLRTGSRDLMFQHYDIWVHSLAKSTCRTRNSNTECTLKQSSALIFQCLDLWMQCRNALMIDQILQRFDFWFQCCKSLANVLIAWYLVYFATFTFQCSHGIALGVWDLWCVCCSCLDTCIPAKLGDGRFKVRSWIVSNVSNVLLIQLKLRWCWHSKHLVLKCRPPAIFVFFSVRSLPVDFLWVVQRCSACEWTFWCTIVFTYIWLCIVILSGSKWSHMSWRYSHSFKNCVRKWVMENAQNDIERLDSTTKFTSKQSSSAVQLMYSGIVGSDALYPCSHIQLRKYRILVNLNGINLSKRIFWFFRSKW